MLTLRQPWDGVGTVSNLSICFQCHRSRFSPLFSFCLCHLALNSVDSAAVYPWDSLPSNGCVVESAVQDRRWAVYEKLVRRVPASWLGIRCASSLVSRTHCIPILMQFAVLVGSYSQCCTDMTQYDAIRCQFHGGCSTFAAEGLLLAGGSWWWRIHARNINTEKEPSMARMEEFRSPGQPYSWSIIHPPIKFCIQCVGEDDERILNHVIFIWWSSGAIVS